MFATLQPNTCWRRGGLYGYNIRMPEREFDEIDARLLSVLQREFPLVGRPFDAVADALGIAPSEVIERVVRLKREGVIRQIGAIFDSAALGYASTLVAFRVAPHKLDIVAEAVSTLDGVSHCYARDAGYNLWFTLTLPPRSDLDAEIATLAALDGVQSHLTLAALRVYKIGVFLDVGNSPSPRRWTSYSVASNSFEGRLTDLDRAAVRVLQKDLPIVESPFAELAREAGMTGGDLLARARALLESGAMRRYAAVLHHRRAGYRANAMVCWQVEPGRIDQAGEALSSHPAVSHCYQRPASPDWPYPLYTMVHCRDEAELKRTIADLAASASLSTFRVLRSVKEYKKSRVIYD
jgi:siroheme decarboxylase